MTVRGALPRRQPPARVTTLIARLHPATPGMPRLAMEGLLGCGRAAVTPLLETLGPRHRGCPAPLPWPAVVLGELGDARAAGPLAGLLAATDHSLAVAAAEALGKLGEAALPAVLARLDGPAPARIAAYAALAGMAGDSAHRTLLAALQRHPAQADVAALALVHRGRRDAIEPLHRALLEGPPVLRGPLECAIAALAYGTPLAPSDGWRLRYRPLPRLGWRFLPGPFGLARARRPGRRDVSRPVPPRSLVDILADPGLHPQPPRCATCGGAVSQPSGVPLCVHTADRVLGLQLALLAGWRAAGIPDAWGALDACDCTDVRLLLSTRATRVPERALRAIAVGRATLYWLIGAAGDAARTALRTGEAQLAAVAAGFRSAPPAGPHKYS